MIPLLTLFAAVNDFFSAVFGVLLAPFGEELDWSAWVDVTLWSVAGGIVALIVYKYVSNQKGIEKTKNQIKVHLLEIRLFKEDILSVFAATGKILVKNALYIGHNLLPVAVMLGPMLAIMIQLVALYAWEPSETGSEQLLKVALDAEHPAVASGEIRPTDVELLLPDGVRQLSPPVRTAHGQIVWKLQADTAGEHVLRLVAGGITVEKRWAVGPDAPTRVPVMRTKTWESLLYPGEDPMPADAPLLSASVAYSSRDLGWMPGGELGILMMFFALSLGAGIALKGVFKVTL